MDRLSLFFGWATIVGIVLAIPLAVLANLLTPKVLDWWATTSTARRNKRIAKLQRQLGSIGAFSDFTFKYELRGQGFRYLTFAAIAGLYYMIIIRGDTQTLHEHYHNVVRSPGGWSSWVSANTYFDIGEYAGNVISLAALFFLVRASQQFNLSTEHFVAKRTRRIKEQLQSLGVDNSDTPLGNKPESTI